MHPKLKPLLLLAKRLAPIPAFAIAFGTWGFIFSRYSEPPIDMAGRQLAAAIAAASASAAAKAGAAPDDDAGSRFAFSPYDACVQQQQLYPSQFGGLECNADDFAATFGWAWSPPVPKGAGARPKGTAAPMRRPDQAGGEAPPGGGESGE
jgi:hypothetical protein